MNFEKQINIDGTDYQLVEIQRSGQTAVYRNDQSFLRMGEVEKTRKDLALHKQMEAFGFPVAKLLGEGEYVGKLYFIEESLGEDCFGSIFKKETELSGHVSDLSFKQFLEVIIKFASAQLKTSSLSKNWPDFEKGIHLDIIFQELPNEKDKTLKRYKQSQEKLDDFPFGILHGDLTPFNIYPTGVIDLEDSFHGPVAYDVGAITELLNWFPETSNDQLHRVYKFTDQQRSWLIETLDNLYVNQSLPKISDYLEDFNFTKGLWFTANIDHLPELQRFRYRVFKALL